MRAMVLHGVNQPVVLENRAELIPGANEVIVRLQAAALNHRDVWIQKGQYAGLKFPIVLGSDGAGRVVAQGSEVKDNWIGKPVIINPSQDWGSSEAFQSKAYKILGLPQDGTFADMVAVDQAYIHPLPPHLNPAQAAALPLAGLTAWRALITRGRTQPQQSVLITGIGGGVALFALQFAVAIGAKVFVTSGSDEKIVRAKTMGAVGGVNYKANDWHKQLQALSPAGFEIIIDGAGGAGFVKLVEIAAPGGRIVNYGATNGNIPDLPLARIFWKQLDICGSTMGSAADFSAMLAAVNTHKIIPIVDTTYSLTDLELALRYMDAGGQFGKIVITH